MLTKKPKITFLFVLTLILLVTVVYAGYAWNPHPVKDDPLVRMPGTQPGQVALQSPTRCMNCHAGYNQSVEPGFNWMGSMMAQSARDFVFWSAMTVAAQDSIWAVGRPNATDLCLRCHFPKGWLEGRSDPTNATLMTGADFDGVQCDFCHSMWDPFFESTHNGTREGNDWLNDWDETNASNTPSQPAADTTYQADMALAQTILLYNGGSFFQNNQPFSPAYIESTSGQYFISADTAKRAPFADAEARHQMLYSRFHKSKYFCATCHDVSNPALANLALDGTLPGDGTTLLPSEQNAAYSYFHVERTFSEFMLSDYGLQGGALGIGPFAPSIYDTSYADNRIAKCQDCHMRDVVGVAANKAGIPIRPNDSVEHPNSGQPLHDLTGGNVWVSTVLASAIPGSPNYDPVNDSLLNQGPNILTLDLNAGEGIDPVAMLAGASRAAQQLDLAASIQNVSYNSATGQLSFQIQNQTGHKLISGFPEGRRVFANIKAYDVAGNLVYAVNPYDYGVGTLKGLPHAQSSPPLGANEVYVDELVYEMHPSSSLTGEAESFHFVLSDGRYKDNRIPPKGFRINEASARYAQPVWHGVEDPGYFTAAEYAGGYDGVSVTIVPGAAYVEINLYYQTTSREYIEFLRDQINGTATTLSSPTPSGEPNAYVVQTDPFFSQLKAWGDTLWNLWTHNMNVDGAKPYLMTQATVGVPPTGCNMPVPAMLSATPGNGQVTLTWSDESADPSVAAYNLYYDQAGKAQLVASSLTGTTYTDSGLTNGNDYCYKVTTTDGASCESGFSNILCAIPNNQGQARSSITLLETGYYTGKGGNRTFVPTTQFAPGDSVVVRAYVIDKSTGLPLTNAVVDIRINGPVQVTLTTGPSDNNGMAEASWQTQRPKGNNPGTPTGSYTAVTTNVTATGYTWDGVMTSTTFNLQ